jgi:hypothetical protein
MSESEEVGHMIRTARIFADVRLRQPRALVDLWKPVEIICEQRDEKPPPIRLEPVGSSSRCHIGDGSLRCQLDNKASRQNQSSLQACWCYAPDKSGSRQARSNGSRQ